MRVLDRTMIGTLLLPALLLLGVRIAKAAEIVPAIGMTKATESDADAKIFGSLAVRGGLLPLLKSEVGVAYRSESRFDDRLHVRMWPITASLYLTPLPMLYAGAGVGWYQITYDYDQSKIPFAVQDETKQEFGVHLGG